MPRPIDPGLEVVLMFYPRQGMQKPPVWASS
jgi:hypothetical protein